MRVIHRIGWRIKVLYVKAAADIIVKGLGVGKAVRAAVEIKSKRHVVVAFTLA